MAQQEVELEFLLLGESADNPNGKLYLMGGGWSRIQSPVFPTVARCGIAVCVKVTYPATESVSIHLRYSNDAKTVQMEMDGQIQPRQIHPGVSNHKSQRIFFVLNGNFPVPAPGMYEISASLPDGQVKTVNFEANAIKMPIPKGVG
jgi:hypothetical protein